MPVSLRISQLHQCETLTRSTNVHDNWTRQTIKLYALEIVNKCHSLFVMLHAWIKPDLSHLLERWMHTWRINVVQRERLLLLYFCPAKLFSSLTVVCQRLWECSACMRVHMSVCLMSVCLCVPEKLVWGDALNMCSIVLSLSCLRLHSWLLGFVPAWTFRFLQQKWGKTIKNRGKH